MPDQRRDDRSGACSPAASSGAPSERTPGLYEGLGTVNGARTRRSQSSSLSHSSASRQRSGKAK